MKSIFTDQSVPKAVRISVALQIFSPVIALAKELAAHSTSGSSRLVHSIQTHPVATPILMSIVYVFTAVIIYQVARGRKWARNLTTCLQIVGLVLAVGLIATGRSNDAFDSPVWIIAANGLSIAAIFLLWTKESSAWFQQRSPISST